jgi:hypothetical protein
VRLHTRVRTHTQRQKHSCSVLACFHRSLTPAHTMRTVYSSYTALFLTLAVLLLPLFSRSEVTSPHPEKAFAMPAHASPLPPVPTHSIGHSCSAVRPHSSSGSVLPTTQVQAANQYVRLLCLYVCIHACFCIRLRACTYVQIRKRFS